MLVVLGVVVVTWNSIEEQMIEVLDWLLFTYEERNLLRKRSRGHTPARQIFRSVGTHNYRVNMMRNLLKNYIGNVKRDEIYDEIIDEFGEIGAKRNVFVHGIYWTHESGKVFIQEQNIHELPPKKPIEIEEFRALIGRMGALNRRILEIPYREVPGTGPPPWLKTPQTPPSENSP